MSDAPNAALSIGPVRFDAASGDLSGPAGTAHLAPQPGQLLALLLAHAGDVVSRDTVREHLWPGGRVEFEQGIGFAVREIRKGIEAAGGDPSLLQTIPRRGFRIQATSTPSETSTSPAASPDRFRGVLVPVLLGFAAFAVVSAASRILASTPSAVAVFAHEADGPAAADVSRRLGVTLTTDLTTALGGVAGVIGPTGTSGFTSPNEVEAIRDRLDACLVASGAVRSFGSDSVVVFTQLVRTADRVHAWARTDTLSVDEASGVTSSRVAEGVRAALEGC